MATQNVPPGSLILDGVVNPTQEQKGFGTGSLQGTMTKPAPAQPSPVPQPQASPTSGALPPPTSASNPFALAQVTQALQTQYQTNNGLMDQRNTALNVLYGMPVSPDQLKKLDPTLQQVLKSGDKNQIEMQIRLINDQVAGRANTLDSSLQFLTNAYTQGLSQMQKQKDDAVSTVMGFVQEYGPQAKQALTALYGTDYINQLEATGVNIDELSKQTGMKAIHDAGITTPYVQIGQEIQDTNSGYRFTSPEDFQQKTGMTLDEAGSKKLISPLKLTDTSLKSGDTQIVTAGGRSLLVNKITGETIKDLGSAYKDGNGTDTTDDDSKEISKFQSDAADYIVKLDANEVSWGAAWNALHAKYPQASNELIDQTLNKDRYYKVTGK